MSAAATFPPLLAAAQRRGSLMRALRAEVPAAAGRRHHRSSGRCATAWGRWSSARRRTGRAGGRDPAVRAGRPARARDREAGRSFRARATTEADARRPGRAGDASAQLLGPTTTKRRGCSRPSTTRRSPWSRSAPIPTRCPPRSSAPASSCPAGAAARATSRWSVTACTFLDRKWPHLAREGEVLLRASLGRFDDRAPPGGATTSCVARRGGAGDAHGRRPDSRPARRSCAGRTACPSTGSHHLLRMAGVEAAIARLGGLAVAGAAYHGVGIRLHRQRPRRGARASRDAPAAPGPRRRPLGRGAVSSSPSRSRRGAGGRSGSSAPPSLLAPGRPAPAHAAVVRLAGRPGLLRHRPGLGRAFNWYGAVVLVLVEASFVRRGRRADAAAARARRRLRRRLHPARSGADDLALRWAAARRRLPRPGRRAARSTGPPGRAAPAHRRRVGRRRRAGELAVVARGAPASHRSAVPRRGGRRDRRRRRVGGGGRPRPRRRGAGRVLRVAPVQGGGSADSARSRCRPRRSTTAQLAATSAVTSARPAPELVLWPEDVVALDRPAGGFAAGRAALGPRPRAAHHPRRRRHRAGVADDVPQRGRRLGPARPHRRHLREGPPGALRRVRPVPLLLRALRRPLGRADRCRPGPRLRLHAHAGRTARLPRLLRGLLRRPEPRVGPGRRRAARRSRRTRRRTARPRSRRRRSRRRGSRPSRRAATSSRPRRPASARS